MKYRFDWILQKIRDGETWPDHWPEDGEGEQKEEQQPRSLRWWEDEGLTTADFPLPEQGRRRQ
jgi:hypothetical protein